MIGPIAALGRGGARRVARTGALARFFVRTLGAGITLSHGGRRVVRRVVLNQIWFTALQAVLIIIVLSGILSYLAISQMAREAARRGATELGTELIGTLMVVAIVRELGPMLTAITVAGRSGTAIAAELGTNTVMGEVRALEGIGIDPLQYLVLPRLVAAIVSVASLILLFDCVAVLAGLAAAVTNGMSSTRYFEIVLRSLTLRDVWLTLAKGFVFGTVIGVVPAFHGLGVRRGPTGVPIAASEAAVGSIVLIFIASALFMAVTQ